MKMHRQSIPTDRDRIQGKKTPDSKERALLAAVLIDAVSSLYAPVLMGRPNGKGRRFFHSAEYLWARRWFHEEADDVMSFNTIALYLGFDRNTILKRVGEIEAAREKALKSLRAGNLRQGMEKYEQRLRGDFYVHIPVAQYLPDLRQGAKFMRVGEDKRRRRAIEATLAVA